MISAIFYALLWCAWPTDLRAQAPRPLSSAVTLSGVVTDVSGTPIASVSIDHSGSRSGIVKTDGEGKFEVTTRAPAVVFRKSGLQSRYVRLEPGKSAGLTIRLDGSAPPARECGPHASCSSLRYFGSAFCLPEIQGVKAGKQSNDVDYGQRVFWIAATGGKVGLRHAAGPMWGSGLPSDEEVWDASEYREIDYRDEDGHLIVDARGRSSDGKYWRELGHAFESVSYRGVSERDTILLDRLLDGACVQPRWFPAERR